MQKALILPRPAGRAGAPKRFYLLGASESPLRQGFAAQNAWDAGLPAGLDFGVLRTPPFRFYYFHGGTKFRLWTILRCAPN